MYTTPENITKISVRINPYLDDATIERTIEEGYRYTDRELKAVYSPFK